MIGTLMLPRSSEKMSLKFFVVFLDNCAAYLRVVFYFFILGMNRND